MLDWPKRLFYQKKPPISDHSYTLESSLLDRLVENIGSLSSIYQKVPELFVKKLGNAQNQRELEEGENGK